MKRLIQMPFFIISPSTISIGSLQNGKALNEGKKRL